MPTILGVLSVGVVLVSVGGMAWAAPPNPPATEVEMSAQHDMIKQDIAVATENIQMDIADVKTLVEALEPGAAGPLCGAGTEGVRFNASADDTEVCDNTTGLYWVKMPDSTTRTHADAVTHCAGLNLSNSQTYRLPEVKELISLVDYSQASPVLPPVHPFTNVQSSFYWAATISVVAFPPFAWDVNFVNGHVSTSALTNDGDFVWCARSGL